MEYLLVPKFLLQILTNFKKLTYTFKIRNKNIYESI